MKKVWGTLILVLFALSVKAHDFHVTITRIDHNPETGSLEVTIRMFTDDLEKALEKDGAPRLQIGAENEHSETDVFLKKYLIDRFNVRVDDQPQSATFLGKEVEDEITWCYVEIENVGDFSEIEVTQKVLAEVFEDQSNIVHVSYRGQKKSLMLGKNLPRDKAFF